MQNVQKKIDELNERLNVSQFKGYKVIEARRRLAEAQDDLDELAWDLKRSEEIIDQLEAAQALGQQLD